MTSLTGYNVILKVTSINNKIHFTTSIKDVDFSVITLPSRASETESLNNKTERNRIKEDFLQKRTIRFKSNQRSHFWIVP